MSDCLFCKIINKEINSEIIDENEYAIAFLDIYPLSNKHTLIIPKKHFNNLMDCEVKYLNAVIELAQKVSKNIMENNFNVKGFNYLSNLNDIAGQVINHFHLHVIPKTNENDGLIIQK